MIMFKKPGCPKTPISLLQAYINRHDRLIAATPVRKTCFRTIIEKTRQQNHECIHLFLPLIYCQNKLNFMHLVSLWWLLHLMLQYLIPHRVHAYCPDTPHTLQNLRAGWELGAAFTLRQSIKAKREFAFGLVHQPIVQQVLQSRWRKRNKDLVRQSEE